MVISNIIFLFASLSAVTMVLTKRQKEKFLIHIELIIISIISSLSFISLFKEWGIVYAFLTTYTYSSIRYVGKYYKLLKN